jgi:hypothetical protein
MEEKEGKSPPEDYDGNREFDPAHFFMPGTTGKQ